MKDTLDRAAVLGLLVQRERAFLERQWHQSIADEALGHVKAAHDRIEAANKALKDVFGIDLVNETVFAAIKAEYGAEVTQHAYPPPPPTETTPALPLTPPQPAISKPTPTPPVHQLVLEQLKEAGDKGSKAAPIRQWIEEQHGLKLHEKTVGMTLYRLLKKGRVRRSRRTWFIVPETVNPGVSAPGLEEMLT